MRKVTVNMYERARDEARKIIVKNESAFADSQSQKLHQAIRTDAKEIEKYGKAYVAYMQGLEIGFLLGIDAANPDATFVAPVPVPSAVPKKK